LTEGGKRHKPSSMKRGFSIWVGTWLLILSAACGHALAQQMSGVGVALRVADDGFRVIQVLPDSAAAASGQIHAGDRILAIAQGEEIPVSTAGMKLAQLVDLIRGPQGSIVRLTIAPAGKPDTDVLEVSLTRSALKLALPSNTGMPLRAPHQQLTDHIAWNKLVLLVSIPLVLVLGGWLLVRRNR
jgi:PDZ domain